MISRTLSQRQNQRNGNKPKAKVDRTAENSTDVCQEDDSVDELLSSSSSPKMTGPLCAPCSPSSSSTGSGNTTQNCDELECMVCLGDINEKNNEDNVDSLPCGHQFHRRCITRWRFVHNTCPTCRDDLEYVEIHC